MNISEEEILKAVYLTQKKCIFNSQNIVTMAKKTNDFSLMCSFVPQTALWLFKDYCHDPLCNLK